jgi:hypothetical protein
VYGQQKQEVSKEGKKHTQNRNVNTRKRKGNLQNTGEEDYQADVLHQLRE